MNSDSSLSKSSLPLAQTLRGIEEAQLIRTSDASHSDAENASYTFKHALVQDTAYKSLMRHDRRRLHLLVGEALAAQADSDRDELAPVLAQHFSEAGQADRALYYFQRAGETAAARYANREAIAFYTQALDAANELQAPVRGMLYRARGQVYDRIGEVEPARADLENALRIARQLHDQTAEWTGLIDLGFFWSALDYARASEYLERALDLAREINDPLLLARSLNRVGNWYTNNEDPTQALTYHHEALQIFESLNNRRGIGETEDLLGMTNTLGGDLVQATRHNRRSIELAQELGNKEGMVAALNSLVLGGPTPQTNTMVPAQDNLALALADARHALPLTRELGWRAGEAYTLWVLGYSLGANGDYAEGLAAANKAFELSQEIGHTQWMVASLASRGTLYQELLALDLARRDLEEGYARAHAISSLHWIRTTGGFLMLTCVLQGDLERAAEVGRATLPPGTPPQTVGERLCYVGRIELALARHDPAAALQDLDAMLTNVPNLKPGVVIPWLWLLRGKMYAQQEQFALAQADFEAGLSRALGHSNVWEQWQLHLELIRVLRAQGQAVQVPPHADAVRALMAKIAAELDETLRPIFVNGLEAKLAGALQA